MSRDDNRTFMENIWALRGKCVLVADDERYVCDLISKVLSRYLGLEVHTANNGAQAVAAALSGRYQAIIIDLVMPNTSGFRAIRAIRTMKPGLPIIPMTARASHLSIIRLESLGITRLLYKPFRVTALLEEVVRAFSGDRVLSPHC